MEAPAFEGDERVIEDWKLVLLKGDIEPRVLDTDVAERGGLAQPRNVRQVIKENRAELEVHGPIEQRTVSVRYESRPGIWQERNTNAFYLNEAQVYNLIALLRTPEAARLRPAMTRVFVAWGKGELPRRGNSLVDQARFMLELAQSNEPAYHVIRHQNPRGGPRARGWTPTRQA